MIFSRRFLILFALGALPLALLWPSPSARWTLILYDLILIALAFWDHHRAGDGTQFEVARRLPRRMMIAAENEVRIVVRARREQTLLIKDEYPPELELRGGRLLRVRTGRGEATTGYRLFAAARGDYQFGDVVGRWSTPWGLAVRQARFPLSEHVRIYPNIHEAQKYELQARSNRLLAAGRRRTRIRGQGKEFESLREYVRGDELRHISWTATARRGRLMTRQYQIERNQSIMIMLDAGRLMTSRIENLAKLDHAINAALAIGYVATRGGDNVGLLVFNREVQTYLPPQRGAGQMRELIEALYIVRAQMIEPSYGRAFQYLAQRCKRRSLVIILTDLVDRDASTELLAHTASLLPRHLPLIVTIGDKDLGALLTEPPHAAGDVYRQSVAEELIAQREEALARITELGGLALDVPAGQLALELVNEYIEVKERGLL